MVSSLWVLVFLLVSLWFVGCSVLLFYFELGLLIMFECVGLEYCDIELCVVDGICLYVWWLLVKVGVEVRGMVLYLYGNGGNLVWYLGGVYWLLE